MTQQDAERRRIQNESVKNAEAARHNRAEETLAPITAGIGAGGRYAASKSGHKPSEPSVRRNINLVYHMNHKDDGEGNHPKWYMNYPSSLRAGSISWLHSSRNAFSNSAVNGAALIHMWIPTIGSTEPRTSTVPVAEAPSGINTALYEVQIKNRAANSGAKNYEQSDIGLAIYATDSVVTLYCELVRAYGLATAVNPWNPYEREDALRALGIDADLSQDELESLYFGLQSVRKRMRNITIPMFPVFARHAFLASNIFKDEPLVNAKVHIYQCEVYGILRETSLGGLPRRIEYRNILGEWGNPSNALDILNTMVSTLLNSTDFVTIMGDLAKAFGDKGFELPDFPIDYTPTPYFDANVLTQIDNTQTVGAPIFPTDYSQAVGEYLGLYDVWDAGGYLAQGSFLVSPATPGQIDSRSRVLLPFAAGRGMSIPLLDAPVDEPTPEDVMVLTRNMPGDALSATMATGINNWGIYDWHEDPNTPGTWIATVSSSGSYFWPDATTTINNARASYLAQVVTLNSPSTAFVSVYGTEVFTRSVSFLRRNNGELAIASGARMAYTHKPQASYYGDQVVAGNNVIEVSLEWLARTHYAATYSEFSYVDYGFDSKQESRQPRKSFKR